MPSRSIRSMFISRPVPLALFQVRMLPSLVIRALIIQSELKELRVAMGVQSSNSLMLGLWELYEEIEIFGSTYFSSCIDYID